MSGGYVLSHLFSKIIVLLFFAHGIRIDATASFPVKITADTHAPVLSPVSIIDAKTGTSIMRTVWHPASTTCYTADALLTGTSLTQIYSDAVHKQAAIMQQKAGLSLDRPIFVMEYDKTGCTYASHRCFLVGLAPEYHRNPNTLACNVSIGHEIGHLVWHSALSTYLTAKDAKDMHTLSYRGALAGYWAGCICFPLSQKTLFKNSYALKAITVAAAILYAFSRWQAHLSSSELHKEELFCDRFAIEKFGKTPQEKIARAQASIQNFIEYQNSSRFVVLNWFYRALTWLDDTVFTSTHPSHAKRMEQMRTCIAEQERLIQAA
jgi:hypothetical protein